MSMFFGDWTVLARVKRTYVLIRWVCGGVDREIFGLAGSSSVRMG